MRDLGIFHNFVVPSLWCGISLLIRNDKLVDPLAASDSDAARTEHPYWEAVLLWDGLSIDLVSEHHLVEWIQRKLTRHGNLVMLPLEVSVIGICNKVFAFELGLR